MEQIAANRVQPALPVRTRTIVSSDDERVGYLVVEVAPSWGAAHGRWKVLGLRLQDKASDE
jgi:hypothetical protein